MGKCFPAICMKSHFSHKSPFSPLSIYSAQVDRTMFFVISGSFRPFGGLQIHLIVYFLFLRSVVPLEIPKNSTKNSFIAILWTIVLTSKVHHTMWLIVALQEAFLSMSRKVSLIDFFVLYFLARLMQCFLIKN